MIVSSSFLNQFELFFPTTNFPSDHVPLFLKFSMISESRPLPIKKVVRDYKSLDFNLIREQIKSSDVTNYNIFKNLNSNKCVKLFNEKLTKIININCSVNTRIFKHDKSKRWFDSNLQQLKKNKRRAERR